MKIEQILNTKIHKRKPGIITEGWWQRTVVDAFKHDPMRIIIELIKNSADSYTRLKKRNPAEKPTFEILIKFSCWPNKTPFVQVIDNGEGMDEEKLEKALAYGAETSPSEDEEGATSAEKGIGLKDAMMSMKDNILITIKDNKLNARQKHTNFDTEEIGKVNQKIVTKQKKELGIFKNGTLVSGNLPEYFKERKFDTMCQKLANHFMLSKLISMNEFKISCLDTWTEKRIDLKDLYEKPSIDESFKPKKELIEIPYQGSRYKFDLEIKKSKSYLEFGKPYGKAGLLFYYGDYTVLDFSFGNSRYPEMGKFFGEVKMHIKNLVRKGDELMVDEKRKGLSDHPLNGLLLEEIDKRIKELADTEREITQYTFKKEGWMQREMQKIYQDIRGDGKKIFQLPIKPKKFEFATPHTDLFEYEPKNIFLIINTSIISSNIEISLKSKNNNIKILTPKNFKISIKENEKDEISTEHEGEKFIVKIIKIYSEKKDSNDELIANLNGYHSSKTNITIISNPIFNPKNGFEFAPKEEGKISIIDEGNKKIDLIIDQSLYNEKEREIETQNLNKKIECSGKFSLPIIKNLDRFKIKNIIRWPFEIKIREGKIKKNKTSIEATYKNKTTNVEIKIVLPSGINFKGIKFAKSEEGNKKISYYDDGYVLIYEDHPLVKKYKVRNWKNNKEALVFIADIATKEFIEEIIRDSIKSGYSKFEIIDQDNPEPEIKRHIINEYHKNGQNCHNILIEYLKSARLK